MYFSIFTNPYFYLELINAFIYYLLDKPDDFYLYFTL